MNAMLKKFWRDEDGGETVEWPLVVGILAVGIVAILVLIRDDVIRVMNLILDQLALVV
jgi:Flp pilus assembly pilin Flp